MNILTHFNYSNATTQVIGWSGPGRHLHKKWTVTPKKSRESISNVVEYFMGVAKNDARIYTAVPMQFNETNIYAVQDGAIQCSI